MTVINAPMEDTVQKHTTLLVAIVPQVNTCQVTPPAIMRAHQTVKHVSAVDIQIKMAAIVVSGVVRENTSLTMRVPELNMIILMTAMNVRKENTVHIITTLLALYVSAVDTQIKLASVVVSGV